MRVIIFACLGFFGSELFSSAINFSVDLKAPEVFFAANEDCSYNHELDGKVCTRLCRFNADNTDAALDYLHKLLKSNCRNWRHGGRYFMRLVRTLEVPSLPDMLEVKLFTLEHEPPSPRFRGSALLRSFCRHVEF